MADLDDIKDGKDFRTDQPQQNIPFTLKGCGALDWGMQSRLSRIFNPKTGNTVMLAFDHGYFQGPTTGLERIDINIAPLFEHADVLMCTRGILRSVVPPATNKPVVLRASGANSILAELSNEAVALSMDDAVRLNSCAVAAQVYIGSEYEHQSIKNIIQLVDAGMKVGMPTMAVTGVGKDMVRDQRYFSLATRIAAEMGAQIIKTYYVDKGFERIVAGCPVPIVIAGGKKLPEREALEMCWQAIDQGASGVDMGRNIFQSDHPVAMMKAVRLNSCAVAAQVYIGSEYEHQSIKNIIQLVDAGMKVGMPTMAVTGVGKDMVRDQRYFSLATRIAAEMGAQIIKTYYVDKGFERIVAGCPVPIVIAGGKKLPEREALEMCWQAIDQGASGVDMGRNIFQSDHPVAMMKAVQAVVHHNETADRAYELYLSEKQ